MGRLGRFSEQNGSSSVEPFVGRFRAALLGRRPLPSWSATPLLVWTEEGFGDLQEARHFGWRCVLEQGCEPHRGGRWRTALLHVIQEARDGDVKCPCKLFQRVDADALVALLDVSEEDPRHPRYVGEALLRQAGCLSEVSDSLAEAGPDFHVGECGQ